MNKIILKGRIARDIDIRFSKTTNIKIANFSIAVKRDYKSQNGEYESDFFNCTAFKNTAEFLEKYFEKGQEILLIGHLQNRTWQDDNGNNRYATDVIVDNIEFCGAKKSNNTSNINTAEQQLNDFEVSVQTDDLPF